MAFSEPYPAHTTDSLCIGEHQLPAPEFGQVQPKTDRMFTRGHAVIDNPKKTTFYEVADSGQPLLPAVKCACGQATART
jgi:hypothetical protein